MPDVKLSQLRATSPASAAAGAALWTHKGHIFGLKLEYVSGTSLRVTSGSAFIPSLGYAVELPAAVTKSSLVLSANTWYHVYLYVNAGTSDIEIVTTAPATAYSGTARAKTGDTSRRYLGSVRTLTGSAALHKFIFTGSATTLKQSYLDATENVRILATGTSTSITTVSAAAFAPVSSRLALLRINNASDVSVRISNSEVVGNATPNTSLLNLPASSLITVNFPLDVNQQIVYWMQTTPGSGGTIIEILGCDMDR